MAAAHLSQLCDSRVGPLLSGKYISRPCLFGPWATPLTDKGSCHHYALWQIGKLRLRKKKMMLRVSLFCGDRESSAVHRPQPSLAWGPFSILQLMYPRHPDPALGHWLAALYRGGGSVCRGLRLLRVTQSPWPADPACHPLLPCPSALGLQPQPVASQILLGTFG